jgi:hypothetical protein
VNTVFWKNLVRNIGKAGGSGRVKTVYSREIWSGILGRLGAVGGRRLYILEESGQEYWEGWGQWEGEDCIF